MPLLIVGFGMKIALRAAAFLDAAHLHGCANSRCSCPQRAAVKAGLIGLIRFLPFGVEMAGVGERA